MEIADADLKIQEKEDELGYIIALSGEEESQVLLSKISLGTTLPSP